MAYERTTKEKDIIGESLDAFVANVAKSFSTQMAVRNAEEEIRFNEAIVEEGLSLEAQLEFRQDQLKRVTDDPTERKRVRGEIAALKELVNQKKFTDGYIEKLTGFQSGLSSIDSVISWLEDQKSTAKDQKIIDKISTELLAKKTEKFTITKNLLEAQTNYALNDKTPAILDTQIGRVASAKNSALLAGNENLVAMYDLQLQSLTKAKAENSIVKDLTTMATTAATGYSSAVTLLDSYNSKVSGASPVGSITVGGVTYGSQKEFWTFKRDSYLADSSNSGFFTQLSNDINTKIKVADSKNNLNSKTMSDALRVYDTLLGRPELAGFTEKISISKQDSVQTGTNLLADRISNRFTVNYDLNQAVADINSIKAFGGKVDDAYTKILSAAATIKQGQVNNILNAVSAALQGNPNLTPEQAFQQAISSGAGTVLSPNDLAGKSEKDLGKQFTDISKGGGTTDPRLTVDPSKPASPDISGQQPAPPATPQTPAPGTQPPTQPQVTAPATPAPAPAAPAAPKFKTITIKQGDTLSGIALRELGSATRFKEIADLNKIQDPNKIQSGANLMIPL